MNKKLIEYIKLLEGDILGIGIDDIKVIKALEENEKILNCQLIESIAADDKVQGKEQKISPQKLRKIFKYKKIDYLIFNHNVMKKHLNIFIKDSIYLTNKKIYFCTKEKDLIIKKYERYNVKIEEEKVIDEYILIIHSNDTNISKIKEIWYDIIDKIEDIANYISDSLIN